MLPKRCKQCNEVLRWVPEVLWDRALRADKVDHYRAESSCGEVYYYDGRGQPVEPATPNLAPDTSEVAQSPMGLIPYADARDHYATLQRGGREGTDGEGAAQERPARPAAAPPQLRGTAQSIRRSPPRVRNKPTSLIN